MIGRSPRHARMVRKSPSADIPLGTGDIAGRALVISMPSSSVAGLDLDGAIIGMGVA